MGGGCRGGGGGDGKKKGVEVCVSPGIASTTPRMPVTTEQGHGMKKGGGEWGVRGRLGGWSRNAGGREGRKKRDGEGRERKWELQGWGA
eukprot:5644715-Pleurochrysis_carterae.AAC.1